MKKIAIGADHAGYAYKQTIARWLEAEGFRVHDFGTDSADSVDYPDFAHPVAEAVVGGEAHLGILICGSGNGVCMSANKHQGIRAALVWNAELAELARSHNDANVLCLPARFVGEEEAKHLAEVFLNATFEGGRHARRVGKI